MECHYVYFNDIAKVMLKICGANWSWTSDLRIFSPTLYLLSYSTVIFGMQKYQKKQYEQQKNEIIVYFFFYFIESQIEKIYFRDYFIVKKIAFFVV